VAFAERRGCGSAAARRKTPVHEGGAGKQSPRETPCVGKRQWHPERAPLPAGSCLAPRSEPQRLKSDTSFPNTFPLQVQMDFTIFIFIRFPTLRKFVSVPAYSVHVGGNSWRKAVFSLGLGAGVHPRSPSCVTFPQRLAGAASTSEDVAARTLVQPHGERAWEQTRLKGNPLCGRASP